jgi:hypothetical protein
MKNRLSDLNNHLFAQLERLSEEDLSEEHLANEVKRSGAIVQISDQITSNADLQLKAAKLYAEHGDAVLSHLPQIGGSKSEG